MNWSKINPHKTKIIAGSAVAAVVIVAVAFYLGVNPIPDQNTASPSQSNQTAQTSPETIDLKIKGNKNSKIYHLRGCASYDRVSERNIVWFKTTDEAEKAGYRMAKNC